MPDTNSQDPSDRPLSDDALDAVAGGNFTVSGSGYTQPIQKATTTTPPTAPTTTTTTTPTTTKSSSIEPNKITFT